MARYRFSNKNEYGFRTGIAGACFLACVALLASALLAEFVIGPAVYPLYRAKNAPDGKKVGTASLEDTPVAGSVADMERLERFTLITTGVVLKYDTINDQGTIYHRLTLPSGEKVVARINQSALTKTGEAGVYRLPVGCWREWEGEPPPAVMVHQERYITDRYVDMVGKARPVLSQAVFCHSLATVVQPIAFLLSGGLYLVLGAYRGRFAPSFFAKRDPLLPRNDLECWCAASCALWARSTPGLEGWPLLTGSHRTRKAVADTKAALAREWQVFDGSQGLEVVRSLTEPWAWATGDVKKAGWDLCRANQLLGMLYHAGMLDRDQLDREFSRVGKVAQRCFSSWEELTKSYLDGYAEHLAATGQNARAGVARLWDILLDLRATQYGPYWVPWRTDLSWSPEGGAGEAGIVKELLNNYRTR